MIAVHSFAANVLAEVLRKQPSSPARTAFAWQLAVGPAMARWTTVVLSNGVLRVTTRDPRYRPEIVRVADTILLRLQELLGAAEVKRLRIE
jgi:hypothetical protein